MLSIPRAGSAGVRVCLFWPALFALSMAAPLGCAKGGGAGSGGEGGSTSDEASSSSSSATSSSAAGGGAATTSSASTGGSGGQSQGAGGQGGMSQGAGGQGGAGQGGMSQGAGGQGGTGQGGAASGGGGGGLPCLALCGNALVNGCEQCDDGNVIPGDGCSGTCQLEGNLVLEMEPNGPNDPPNSLMGYEGAIGAIEPTGDKDSYSFDVAVPYSSVIVAVTNGLGGCPVGFSSSVKLYDAAKNLLASDLAGGPLNCSLITPLVHVGATNLAVGKYTVEVEENGNNATTMVYVVEVTVVPPTCGDGIAQPPEECDDFNMASGDGCVSCLLEGAFTLETEPNSQAAPNPLGGFEGVVASIDPVADVDWFSVDVVVPYSSLIVQTTNGVGGCPLSFDSVLTVFDPASVLLVTDDNSGPVNCSLINPALFPKAAYLPAGTYTIKVADNGNNGVQAVYVLEAQVVPPACEDGLAQPPEQCDDGNMVDGDGCSACQLEGNFTTESEPNGQASPNSLTGFDGAIGSISPLADQDFFSFDVAVPGSSVTVEVTNGSGGCPAGFDSVVTLMTAANTVVQTDDNNGPLNCSLITPQLYVAASNLAAGAYKVKVEEFGNNAVQPVYVLKVRVAPPACPDGFAQPPEQCDDNNMVNGDGCSLTCQLEGNFTTESEPNGQVSPNAIDGFTGAVGSISPVADQDFFTFDIAVPGSSVIVDVTNGYGGCPTGFDSVVTLMTAANTVIQSDDNSGPGNCSLITPQLYLPASNLAAGTYKVKVEENGNNAVQPVYVVKVQVVPPACHDGFAQPGEQCDDGNMAGGDGCSAACQLESGVFTSEAEPDSIVSPNPLVGFAGAVGSISPVGDVDFYTFDVVSPASSVTIVVGNGLGGCPPLFDSKVTLLGPGDVVLATDDNNGPVNCSQLTPAVNPGATNLAVGTYKVKVEENGNNAAQPVYVLQVTVTP